MNQTILQIPLNKGMRDKAKKVAKDQGFSSLQEAVRVFLNQLAEKEIEIGFVPAVMLSSKNDKKYAKMLKERKEQKGFSTSEELLEDLLK